ncbi:hypothetical protein Kpol_1045p26 [Vanderwaltozyma polyspora DSM 70294]|uniref:C2 NT-type domain-containing protein n=1 Tax=Vanderwaltozyma polyspora (strain ATCC 22028 / DSM 70294 / BCRC 21397 / CBS 2163 / NBRC 10782 / NRRL Y-8283 / UCD 57-17) TaxID=436907 RepID=A7TI33_VANPO|nr:uncharacterized protein Kpol_1045p26 [Vanderwaltozyma polyspora DSM 70294]EDO18040.1 hypothetical protein Kpol_1045p26 [Vanderwaltozyma polyspora DSM 70294]
MVVITTRGKEKRPKFLLEFSINELINVPQSTGYCYVKWSLKDGTGISSHRLSTVESIDNQMVNTKSKGETSKHKVKSHKVDWGHVIEKPIPVKLHVDKDNNLIEKLLRFRVIYQSEEKSGRGSEKLDLGTVNVNIADYVREDEMAVSNRFLLKDSRINSLLSISIQMKLYRGTYREFNLPLSKNAYGQIPGAFHTSISEILEDVVDINSPTSSLFKGTPQIGSPRPSLSPRPTPLPIHTAALMGHSESQFSSNVPNISAPNTGVKYVSPLVDKLLLTTFHMPWDPRPGEYNPRECVEDIIRGGNGWAKNGQGIKLIDLQALKLSEEEFRYYKAHTNSGNTDIDDAEDAFSLAQREILSGRHTGNTQSMGTKEYLKRRENWNEISKVIDDTTASPLIYTGASQIFGGQELTQHPIVDTRSWSVSNNYTA